MLPPLTSPLAILYTSLSLLALVLLRKYWNPITRHKKSHPPSPWSLPILGNLLSIPDGMEHIAYMKLGEQLNSNIIYLRLFGYNFVVLNSARTATDLLDKRSRSYSDRLCPAMVKEPNLLDWSNQLPLLGYNDTWRLHRRMLNKWLNVHAVTQFQSLQEHQVRLMLQSLVDVPGQSHPFEAVKKALFLNMGSLTMKLAYGYSLRGNGDPIFHDLIRLSYQSAHAAMFSNFFVNIFPALKYVPDWFPGAGWKRTAREWRALKEYAQSVPYEWTKAQLAAGAAEPSILGMLLQNQSLISSLTVKEQELHLKELAWIIVAAGTDTTSETLVAFIAAMVLNPYVQTKAQKELDDILGPLSLPTIADRQRLPYTLSLVQELLRWHPVVPSGVPHMCWQDDVYEGYEIERGTVVIGNIWAMTRDENVYKDPKVFDPDRFLDPNVPHAPAFGWGRRKCPGVYFAEASLFVTAASLLATFRFSKKKDFNGQEIQPKLEIASNSIVMELKPFDFEFELRSEKHRELIMECSSV